MADETILFVDDDSSVLNALRTLLGRRLKNNRMIEIAESADEALEIVEELAQQSGELAVIVADYIMPGMKGDELLVEVHRRSPKTMTVMLTGQSDMHGVKRAINEANLFRFLEKPWQNDDIVLTLQAALNTYELDRELQRHIVALRHMNEELEATVAERTQELVQKNQELERLSITDRLTGLYNRLFLDRTLEHEFASAGRHGGSFSIILLDIDHFKNVNDTYGHLAGDQVLTTIGQILKGRVRETDVAGRWGGEEFLVICPNTSLTAAAAVAETLRGKVEQQHFPVVGARTMSFGVASYRPGDTIITVEARADNALYAAKDGGRNRVMTAG